MKICFVSMTNLYLCPYIKKYQMLLKYKCDIDLILWNKHNISENTDGYKNIFEYKKPANELSSRFIKIFQFFSFSRFCKKIIKSEKYDRIIFLHNNTVITLLCYLKKSFSGRYLIDIRDYTMENNWLYYLLEKIAIKNSAMAVISSEGYKCFLPKANYVVSHNDTYINDNSKEYFKDKKLCCHPIQISFIGLVRFFEQNKKLLDIFGNDVRFILAFYGQNSDQLKKYAERCEYKNVVFVGHFPPEQTLEFYKHTNVINNYYGNDSMALRYALSNKLYYAASLSLPILVCKNTYMYEVASKYSIGLSLNEASNTIADDFYYDYINMNFNRVYEGGKLFMEKVTNDNMIFKKALENFVS